ncbi:CDT1-like protein a, chloroplastic [Dichanthelium oligosanthes]|uniref:CDT1-like protein a, chloroplastic n=1 Tax=Dichanthelium oligosanthes TaxID=888268 RepID=A0A1E5WA94_9POAL|nr:CDT1-like protein a, chloroplastic [Dichanthelium oligosanthes]
MEMHAAPPSKKAKTTAEASPQKLGKAAALADQILTPEKPAKKTVAAAAVAEQILTPEKPEERSRARGRSVAFSVKEIRRAALGLRRPAAQAEAAAVDELESVERELGVGAGRSPVKRKAEVKLPESYEMLCEFFNCLESSTRLLRMKGSKATFPNICASIQHLSDRSNVSGSMCVDDKSSAKEVQVSEVDLKDVSFESGILEGTPAKFAATPVRLMASTPDLKTPKRPISVTGYDTPPLKMAKRSARAKLFTTPTKGVSSMDGENQIASTSAADGDDELLSFLPQSLLQSVKEKEERASKEKETGFADQVKRQKLIASLPSTFDIIFLIYQSRQRSVMTKQELIHKIIASSPKIVDRSEIEEQLALLKEFAPDWISEKTARSGDALCCVDASLSQAEIRQRLYAAK